MAGPLVTYAAPTSFTSIRHDDRFRPQRQSRSTAKRIERRLIRLWKRVTGTMRRKERASILPDGFVLLNAAAARRRSMYISSNFNSNSNSNSNSNFNFNSNPS
ncbi:hypothetical protein B0F90DRAFT_1751150 [Multifurca ochricompacta]|uniref:Uncharacterized protein n=1 Tax=Multifurca ochricompacta TaxID=376703 RepID=A0AAD4M0U2_9AGAM|nr:hypothetical protein B0F90DRAFT_1751150 [Multifurca ochricompacta]